MLDETSTILSSTAAWQDHVTYGDIVLYRFPLAEEESAGRPIARPCLILDIKTKGGQKYALLAYGTTSRRRSNISYEVHVRPRAEYLPAGLNEPTKFVGKRRLLVPLSHKDFVVSRATGSAVIGRLDGEPLDAVNAVRGRIHAEADIAADHRSQPRRWLRRDFAVESLIPRRTTNVRKAVQK